MRARVVPVHHGSYETYVTGRSIGESTSHTSTPETGSSDPSTVHNQKVPNHSKKPRWLNRGEKKMGRRKVEMMISRWE